MLLEPVGGFDSLPFLQLHHDAQRFARLMRPEFVQQVVDVNEEQTEIVHFFRSLWRLGALYYYV